MSRIYFLVFILITSFSFSALAQTTVSLDEVLKAAVEHNYDLKIARNDIAFTSTNATIGAAGFLPTVDIGASYNYSISDVNTQFSGGIPDQNITGAASQNYGANANLRYTLFDGLKPLYRLRQSKLQVAISNNRYQQAIEATLFQVIQAYYNLALLQEDYRLANEKLTFTKRQLNRVEVQREYGQGSEVERLNLLTTYNSDSTQLLRIQLSQRQAVQQLNKAIGTVFLPDEVLVEVTPDLDLSLNYEALLEATLQNNLAVLNAQQNLQDAELSLQITKTELYPKLSTTLTYGYSGSTNDAGIVVNNSSLGPSINLGLTYNIYGAGAVKRAREQNKINIQNRTITVQATRYNLEQDLKDAYITHENNIALIPLEESNVRISKTSFERATEAYQLGQTTLLQYQQAELNYVQAQKRVIVARYNAKLSEWQLRRLAGLLTEK
jgi:outer membrane protein TolC